MSREYISGCRAAAEAARLARVDVVSAYPITPQSGVVEQLTDFVFDGKLDAETIPVESEHSAMSAAVGAAMTGVRTFTATSSQGLALMHEVLPYASGLRLPIVVAIANRSVASPVTIFTDHQDILPQRETGFMQFYVENCQEILDNILIAYRVAEHEDVLLPAMVSFDGFFLSHIYEPVEIPGQERINEFLPEFQAHYPTMDVDDPKAFNVMAFPDRFEEFQRDKYISMEKAGAVYDRAAKEFEQIFDRSHSRIEAYKTEDADYVLTGLGCMMGTVRETVDRMREEGEKVGMVKIKCYRPFPLKEIVNEFNNCQAIGVLDRDVAYGSGGVLYQDMTRSLYNSLDTPMANFIVGLGGRDVNETTVRKCFAQLEDYEKTGPEPGDDVFWPDENKDLLQKWKVGEC